MLPGHHLSGRSHTGAAVTSASTLLLVVPTTGVLHPGQAASAPPSLASGVVSGLPVHASSTVLVGAQQTLPNGDVVVHPVAASTSTDGSFTLTGPLAVPVTRNPDGSVPLVVQVVGDGRTKIFDLNALPPDAAHPAWRWSRAVDVDLVAGRTDRVAGGPVSGVTLDMTGAVSAPDASTATTAAAPPPTVTPQMRRAAVTGPLAAAAYSCATSTWAARQPLRSEKRWVPVQRFTLKRYATQTYTWMTSRGTQMQVAYATSNRAWKGGFAYSSRRGAEAGFTARFTTAYWAGYLKTRWRFVLQDQYCPATTWPYPAVRTGVHRWWPRSWDGSALPVTNRAVWHCKPGTGSITRYPEWVARTSTSRMSGQFAIGGVALDAMQTNSWSARHRFLPRSSHVYRMCGNTDDVPSSRLVKEYMP